MRLFQSRHTYEPVQNSEPVVKTPLGNVFFDLHINRQPLSEWAAEMSCYRLSNGGTTICYQHPDFLAELVICEPAVGIPAHMKVEKAVGAVWRVKPLNAGVKWDFIATFHRTHTDVVDGGPESGECLDAIGYYHDNYHLTLGTQDGPVLARRSRTNDLMPVRFEFEEEWGEDSLVKYIENGLMVPIPEVTKNEICQVHFMLAWNKLESEDDNSSWFAVDMDGENILSCEELV